MTATMIVAVAVMVMVRVSDRVRVYCSGYDQDLGRG